MEAASESEYDVFFADISKQISLLIMDDDEDSLFAHCPSVNPQALTQAIHPARKESVVSYDNQQTSCSKGTGVFIPRRSSYQRRISTKKGRFIDSNNKFERPSDHNKSRGFPHHKAHYNMNPSCYDSSNQRRF